MALAMQHSMLWPGTGLVPSSTGAASRGDINYPGPCRGLMAQSPPDAGADKAPMSGDFETAGAFGARFAKIVRDSLR